MKIKAWGIRQGVWGHDYPSVYWFSSKAARDEYYSNHKYCDKLRCRLIGAEEVYESEEAMRAAHPQWW